MKINSFVMGKLTVIPVRASCEDTSEMVTQLLFGEIAKIIEIHQQWLKIEIVHDSYIGWVDNKQLYAISEESATQFLNRKWRQTEDELKIITPWGLQRVLQGSPVISQNKTFAINDKTFEWKSVIPEQQSLDIFALTSKYINSPYLWGGRTKYGIDCSGLTQTIFHQLGVYLPRDASQQVLVGDDVKFEEKQTGDLAFFKSEKSGKITHVGIVLSDSEIVHAHGRVRKDKLKEKGIYNEEEQFYSHHLAIIKRYKF